MKSLTTDQGWLGKGPVTIGWLAKVARSAVEFFNVTAHERALDAISKPRTAGQFLPLHGGEFVKYLESTWLPGAMSYAPRIRLVLDALVRAGVLHDQGPANTIIFLARSYWYYGGITQSQWNGFLWLGEALGAELLVPSYASATAAIAGQSSGASRIGTGLIISPRHILTCAHVVTDMEPATVVEVPPFEPPGIDDLSPSRPTRIVDIHIHEAADIAVLELDPPIRSLPSIAFRNPEWTDPVTILGYPPVPFSRASSLVVQSGEVANPEITTLDGMDVFLFSAIARPGNSGGPIIGSDGRMLGLVTKELTDAAGSTGAPFYAGVPSRAIKKALDDLGLDPLMTLETWK